MAKIVRHDSNLEILNLAPTATGGYAGRARVTRTGVFIYRNPDGTIRRELRHPDDVFLKTSLDSLRMIPITVTHPTTDRGLVTAETAKSLSVGFTGETVNPDGIYIDASVVINTKEGVQAVNEVLRELSLGYEYEREEAAGEYNGQVYDYRQRNIFYNHLALVRSGRAGPEVRLDVATDGVEVAETIEPTTDNPLKRSGNMAKQISLDGGLTYEVPAEVAVAYDKIKIAHDEAIRQVETSKNEVQKLTGERDTLQAQLKVAQDAASPASIQKAVTCRVALEKVANDVLDAETAKLIPTLNDVDLKKLVVKTKLPSINLDKADPIYVQACFDAATVVVANDGTSDAGASQQVVANGDLTKPAVALDAAEKSRKAMQDRMTKAYQEK